MVRWTVRLLALVALVVSTYLAWISLQAGDATIGCGVLPQFDCDHVLTSRWSVWLRVPVSVPAVAVYATIFAASFLIGSRVPPRARRAAWAVLMLLVLTAAGAALWFVALLLFVIKQLCLYCTIVHACGLTSAGLVLTSVWIARRRKAGEAWMAVLRTSSGVAVEEGSHRLDPTRMSAVGVWSFCGLGLAGVAILIGGQLLFPPKQYRFEQLAEVAEEKSGSNPTDAPAGRELPQFAQHAGKDPQGSKAEESGGNPPKTSQIANSEIPEPVPLPPTPTPRPSRGELADVPRPTENTTASADEPGRQDPSIVDGKVVLDTYKHPILGKPDAKHVVVELFDYTCEHCRTLYHYLQQARDRYGKQFAVVVLPVPMNADCNKFTSRTHPDQQDACHYARLALAVWEIAPSEFEDFHKWLLKEKRPPGISEATDRAARLVGQEKLEKERKGPAVKRRIEDYVRLFGQAGRGSIPKILAGKWLITGEAANAQEIFDLLERALEIKPIEG